MPLYVFEKDGERIEKSFPMGKAPQTYKGYKRIIDWSGSVQYKGEGWAGKGKTYEIDKWMSDNQENIRGYEDVKPGKSREGFTSYGSGAKNQRSFGNG